MIVLSIDSSISNIGWAVLDDTETVGSKMLKGSGTLKIPNLKMASKAKKIMDGITSLIDQYDTEVAVIERPMSFTYARTSRYTRSLNQSAMAKNNIAVGIISATCIGRGLETHYMSAQDWKGKQPKEVTIQAVNILFGTTITKSKHDEADAIKMGQVFIEDRRYEKLIKGETNGGGEIK